MRINSSQNIPNWGFVNTENRKKDWEINLNIYYCTRSIMSDPKIVFYTQYQYIDCFYARCVYLFALPERFEYF